MVKKAARKKTTKKGYVKTGRKLAKSPAQGHFMKAYRKKVGLGVSGHGKINRQKLTATQITTVSKKGGVSVKLKTVGKTVRVTPGNLFSDGHIEYYKRSDTKKIAVRRPGSDKKRTASHLGTKRRPMIGD